MRVRRDGGSHPRPAPLREVRIEMVNCRGFSGTLRSGVLVLFFFFFLSALFGESDPMKILASMVFPEKHEYAVLAIPLRPVHHTITGKDQNTGPSYLFLTRHGRKDTQNIKILDYQNGAERSQRWFGSHGNIALPKQGKNAIDVPQVLLEADLPPESLAALVSRSIIPPGSSTSLDHFAVSFNQGQLRLDNKTSVDLLTSNEVKRDRITLVTLVVLTAFLMITIGQFKVLRFEKQRNNEKNDTDNDDSYGT
jgi:hypothetical protein